MLNSLKKIAIYTAIILGIIYGYQYMTGKSIANLPRGIFNKLQQNDPAAKSTNPKYYSDPEKNMPKD